MREVTCGRGMPEESNAALTWEDGLEEESIRK